MKVLAGMAWLGLAGAAWAQWAGFDPRAHRDFAGPPTELLVLGTPHLAGLPESFRTDSLGPLLDRLAAWKPAIITIEGLSGPDCEMLQRYKERYGSAAEDYCRDLAPAEKAIGLTIVAATAEAQKLLDAQT